jgi:ubiquinone biosynthesis protein COQ4
MQTTMRSIILTTGRQLSRKNNRTLQVLSTISQGRDLSTSSSQNEETEPFYGSPRSANSAPKLSTLQSLTLATYSATKAFLDPERHDMVATLSELTGHVALQNMYDSMMADKIGQRILIERPIVSKATIDIHELEQKEKNTFGYAYAMFLKQNDFDPDLRADVKYVQDEELRYVMTRYRQSHDFYHVITDLPPTIPGELALKFAELFQTGLPICALSATVGSLKLDDRERELWKEEYLPWAIKVGKDGGKWINTYWEEEFDTDLQDLRKRLGVVIAPKI